MPELPDVTVYQARLTDKGVAFLKSRETED